MTSWSGWVYKRRGSTSEFKHLYCVLKDKEITFFSRKGGREKGGVSLDNIRAIDPVVDLDFQDNQKYRIVLHDDEDNDHVLVCHSEEDFELWLDGLRYYAERCSNVEVKELQTVNLQEEFAIDDDGLLESVANMRVVVGDADDV